MGTSEQSPAMPACWKKEHQGERSVLF
jgi:hypothetical protein